MSYDVFLSHNSRDKDAVKVLGTALKQRGISVWLDEWELQPGLTWMDALESIVRECRAATICLGRSGMGAWEVPEAEALLRRFVSEKKNGNVVPVIPVLLPGAPSEPKLPMFLEAFNWVDLRKGLTSEGLERLRWGITGEKPLQEGPTVCLAKVTPDLRNTRAKLAEYLTSARINVLPSRPYEGEPSKYLATLDADLKRATVFVQVLGEVYADRTEDCPEGEERAQWQLAERLGAVTLQWRDPSVDLASIDDEAHRELVGGATVVSNDPAEFGMLVAERAKRLYDAGRPAGADQPSLALVRADKADEDVAREISEALASANINCRLTRARKSLVDLLREVPYDAVLIVCGQCDDEWLEAHGDELMALDLNLKDQAPVRAYYVCAEEAYLPYRSKAVLQIKRRDQTGWEQLMTAIQQRRGRS